MKVNYLMPFILTLLASFVAFKLMEIVQLQHWLEAIFGAILVFIMLLFGRVIRKKDITWFRLKLGI